MTETSESPKKPELTPEQVIRRSIVHIYRTTTLSVREVAQRFKVTHAEVRKAMEVHHVSPDLSRGSEYDDPEIGRFVEHLYKRGRNVGQLAGLTKLSEEQIDEILTYRGVTRWENFSGEKG